MTTPGLLLWGVLPFVALVLLIGGTAWRHKYDKFGWTTRSSQLLESRFLRIASPVFHYGILGAIAGHLLGLVLPERWTAKIHINENVYHQLALIGGIPAGIDKTMYMMLAAALALGLSATFWNIGSPPYDYREGVSLWFRDLFALRPEVTLMQGTPPAAAGSSPRHQSDPTHPVSPR